MAAVVEHRHVLRGYDDDETNQAVYRTYFDAQQRGVKPVEDQVFELFMRDEFPKAVKRIKDFQDYLPGEQYNPPRGMRTCVSSTP